MSRRTTRVTALAAVAVLLAGCLAALAPGAATAATETFRPPGPRTHLKDVTVTSTPAAWRVDVRTERPRQVLGYEVYLDIGQRRGSEFVVYAVPGRPQVYRTPRGSEGPLRSARCPRVRVTELGGAAGPGARFTFPQRCLAHYAGPNAGRAPARLRLRVAVVWTPPRGNCRYDWSPREAPLAFHGWVPNHPSRTRTVAAAPRATPAVTRPAAVARRGC